MLVYRLSHYRFRPSGFRANHVGPVGKPAPVQECIRARGGRPLDRASAQTNAVTTARPRSTTSSSRGDLITTSPNHPIIAGRLYPKLLDRTRRDRRLVRPGAARPEPEPTPSGDRQIPQSQEQRPANPSARLHLAAGTADRRLADLLAGDVARLQFQQHVTSLTRLERARKILLDKHCQLPSA